MPNGDWRSRGRCTRGQGPDDGNAMATKTPGDCRGGTKEVVARRGRAPSGGGPYICEWKHCTYATLSEFQYPSCVDLRKCRSPSTSAFTCAEADSHARGTSITRSWGPEGTEQYSTYTVQTPLRCSVVILHATRSGGQPGPGGSKSLTRMKRNGG